LNYKDPLYETESLKRAAFLTKDIREMANGARGVLLHMSAGRSSEKCLPVGFGALVAVVMTSSIRIKHKIVTCFMLVSYLVYSSILNIEAVCASEMSIHFFNLSV
jgi:hypothetical protein